VHRITEALQAISCPHQVPPSVVAKQAHDAPFVPHRDREPQACTEPAPQTEGGAWQVPLLQVCPVAQQTPLQGALPSLQTQVPLLQ
jgi:hypothetical protein